jgi:outer membrane protein TolC
MRLIPLSFLALTVAAPALAQDAPEVVPAPAPTVLTLEDAVEIAAVRSYTVRIAGYDVATARSQVAEAYGQLLPSLDASSSYTRNVVQANPFAGSSAGNIFGGLGAIGWLQYNEQARTDGDPSTDPITFAQYNQNVSEGQQAVGYNPASSDNPFGTDNSFVNALSVSQTLYSGAAFAAVKGAKSLVQINEAALEQQEQEAVHAARVAFFDALLAQEQADVLQASVSRAAETADETARRVAVGTAPKLQRLSAEVRLANLQTQRIQAENAAQTAKDALLLQLGLPVGEPLLLRGDLQADPQDLVQTVAFTDAAATADDARPDLRQARLAVDLLGVQRGITRSQYFPTLSAFADLSYVGNVPDDRGFIVNDPEGGAFDFQTGEEGFFSDAYWQPAVAVGLRLNWNLFNGFQTSRRVQQDQLAIEQAEVQLEQAEEFARFEVQQALRTIESAQRRIAAQDQNLQTAELAYAFTDERLAAGVAQPIELREASDQLDQARLAYLQAVRDLLVSQSELQRVTGTISPEAPRARPGFTLVTD